VVTPDQRTVPKRSLARVWSHRGYRGILVSLVLSGISVSAYVPLMSLYLVQTLRAREGAVGLFALTSLSSPVVGIVVGRLSDRLSSRLRLLVVVGAWLALGRVAMGLAPTFEVAVVLGIVFGAFGGISAAQVFALLRELLEREGEPRQATITSTVRTGYSLGWAVGPVLGSLLAAGLGYRAALAMSGAFVLLPLIPLLPLRQVANGSTPAWSDARPELTTGASPSARVGGRERAPWGSTSLWLFAVVCFLALTGESLRLTYLPILAVDRLGVPLWFFGVLVSVAPVVELAAMPAAGALADRFGLRRVLAGGLLFGAGGFAAFATSSSIVGLLIGQFCNACFIAVLLGLGVSFAQRLHPGGAGFAASVFFAAQSLTIASAGLLGAALADRPSGLPDLFFTALMLDVAAVVLLLFIKPPPTVRADRAGRPAGGR
jgi:SET family sugar efflux transporter-like MFS transporter